MFAAYLNVFGGLDIFLLISGVYCSLPGCGNIIQWMTVSFKGAVALDFYLFSRISIFSISLISISLLTAHHAATKLQSFKERNKIGFDMFLLPHI